MDNDRGQSALVGFWARNVRCFRDEVFLSMEATRLANETVVRVARTASATPSRLLPIAGVFGANASGKSALLTAMWDMKRLAVSSFRDGASGANIRRIPFLLGSDDRERPSEYGVEVILDRVTWRYAFEVADERVVNEYAVHYPKGRQALVFEREHEKVVFGPRFRSMGKAVGLLQRKNALLLSTAGALRDNPLTPLFDWFEANFLLVDADTHAIRRVWTAELAQDDAYRSRVLGLLRAADLGISEAEVEQADEETAARVRAADRVMRGRDPQADDEDNADEDGAWDSRLQRVRLLHRSSEGVVSLDPWLESIGTQVWLGLIAPVLRVLDTGSVLLVDELDGSLHPLLVERLVTLFQNADTNPRCAQLIFNAHDLNLLAISAPFHLGRDQVWTVEKDAEGASRIQPVAEYKPRADEALGRRYVRGRYGGIPRLVPGSFDHAVRAEQADR
ncbi:MAG: ATP-binding protein [Gammaproteobacteria bacterium]|nr:ATP-binding protein [Gammaproteobacteria bacterium]